MDALLRSEEHFRRLTEHAADMIQVVGPDAAIRYTGPSVERLLGYTPGEIEGTSAMSYLHPDDVPGALESLGALAASPGVVLAVAYRVRHRDGSWRHFEANCRTFSPDSASEGYVVNARDVTERVEAEDSIRQREEHFRQLIENASDLIQVIRLDGSIEYTSPSVERLLGYTPAELAGMPVTDPIHPDDLPTTQAALVRAFSEPGVTVSAQYRVQHRDGSWRWIEGTGHAVGSEAGSLRVIANARDVTERVEAERAAQEARARAEASLAELREAQDRLVQQEKLAGLGRVVAGIAHEMMNPLNFVTNFADLTQEAVEDLRDALGSGDPDEVEALLDDLALNAGLIAEHGRRASATVRSMIQHAQVRSGVARLLAFNALVEEYVALAEQSVRSRGLAVDAPVDLALDPRVGRVRAVPEDVGRVVVNVVTNALEAAADAPTRGVVTVSTQRDGHAVSLRVEDTGPGVAPDEVSRFFEPFYTTRPTGRGNVGLGLSISRDIVSGHYGGTIDLANGPGGGAVCTVVLPAPHARRIRRVEE